MNVRVTFEHWLKFKSKEVASSRPSSEHDFDVSTSMARRKLSCDSGRHFSSNSMGDDFTRLLVPCPLVDDVPAAFSGALDALAVAGTGVVVAVTVCVIVGAIDGMTVVAVVAVVAVFAVVDIPAALVLVDVVADALFSVAVSLFASNEASSEFRIDDIDDAS